MKTRLREGRQDLLIPSFSLMVKKGIFMHHRLDRSNRIYGNSLPVFGVLVTALVLLGGMGGVSGNPLDDFVPDVEPACSQGLLSTALAPCSWVARYNGPLDLFDSGEAIALSPEGDRLFAIGWTATNDRIVYGPSPYAVGPDNNHAASNSIPIHSDYLTVAYDTTHGAELWTANYSGPGGLQDQASAAAVSPDGSMVYVTGASPPTDVECGHPGSSIARPCFFDYATVAYDTDTGDTIWESRYARPGSDRNLAQDVLTTADGSLVLITGNTATVAYDALTGAEVWVTTHESQAMDMDLSPDGTLVFVTGGVNSQMGDDYWTSAYDTFTGTQNWERLYDGPSNRADHANALKVSPDGSRLFVTGKSGGVEGSDYATVSYDAATGQELWAARLSGQPAQFIKSGQALDVAVSPDGSLVFVTGHIPGSHYDYATVAYQADSGAEIWVQTFNGAGSHWDSANSIGVNRDGSAVVVTGSSRSSAGNSGADYATIWYNTTTGEELRIERYDGPKATRDKAYDLKLGPDDTVYVIGRSNGGNVTNTHNIHIKDLAIVAYRPIALLQLP